MKKILILSLITTFSLVACAQKGVVRDATRSLKSNDLNEARTLIKQAAENPETANDPETWKLMGDIGNKAFDNERTNEMLGKASNADVRTSGCQRTRKKPSEKRHQLYFKGQPSVLYQWRNTFQ